MNFIKKIFSPATFTLALFFFFYTIFKSEFVFNGAKRDYYYLYYIISIIFILFSILTFFINQKIKEYLIISFFSVILSLYFFETYLISKDQFKKDRTYKKKTNQKWDGRTQLEIYDDLKNVNNEIQVIVQPKSYLNSSYKLFPLSGVANSETIYCNENGYYSIYNSDRFGFNNIDDEWNKKDIEYILIGDSFVHGACVNRPNDIASVLRNISNKSVLNLGYSGNGPLINYATLREYLRPNVKKVLWFYYEGNDLNDLKRENRNKTLLNYLNNSLFTQNLKFKQNAIDELGKSKIEKEGEIIRDATTKIKIKKIIQFFKIWNLRNLLQKNESINEPPPPHFERIIKLTKDLTYKNATELYFIYLPEFNRYKTEYNNNKYQYIKNIINNHEISFIDINKEVFEKEENPLKLFPFGVFGHYTAEGYEKISKAIYNLTSNYN